MTRPPPPSWLMAPRVWPCPMPVEHEVVGQGLAFGAQISNEPLLLMVIGPLLMVPPDWVLKINVTGLRS